MNVSLEQPRAAPTKTPARRVGCEKLAPEGVKTVPIEGKSNKGRGYAERLRAGAARERDDRDAVEITVRVAFRAQEEMEDNLC